MHTISILGVTRHRNPRPNKGGSTVIAYFDVEANGLEMKGCALVRTPKQGLTVWAPKVEGPGALQRAVTIVDSSLRHAMMMQAREAYRKIGGTEAEFIGTAIPADPTEYHEATDRAGLARYLSDCGSEMVPDAAPQQAEPNSNLA